MHVIIAGCGRVGAQLAARLDDDGHDVVVIDKNPDAFARLEESFAGRTLAGVVFDRPTLEEAGIRQAQAFIAVTSGDNSNIVSARTAKERYGVSEVVARIYDPERAAIYERVGITTIASARWTAEAILRAVLPGGEAVVGAVGDGQDVVLLAHTFPPDVVAVAQDDVVEPGRAVLAGVTRAGRTSVPKPGAVLTGGDTVHLAVAAHAVDAVRARLQALHEESGA